MSSTTMEIVTESHGTGPAAELQDFDRVIALYRPRVFRFILASIRDQHDAESLTQDCFLKAFRHRDQFRGDASVKTWLLQIAANLVRDLTRTRRFQFWKWAQSGSIHAEDVSNLISSRDASPEATTLVQEQVRGIWTATRHLSERQRTVFLLRYVEDMSLLEIAETLGTTEGTVKKHLFRAVEVVRKHTRKLR